jgi:hypothetical protein
MTIELIEFEKRDIKDLVVPTDKADSTQLTKLLSVKTTSFKLFSVWIINK